MAEVDNQEVKSRRDSMVERLKGKYPDKEFADDEAIYGQISDDYDDYDNQLSSYRDREQGMVDMMTKDPRSANFLAAWHQGENPLVAMMRMYGPELKDALDDPDLQDKLEEAQKDYLDRMSKDKELEQEAETNIQQSIAERDAFQQENGLSDEEMNKIWDTLQQMFEDALKGKFSRESMDMVYKAINHDTDVAAAADEAEVRGRNSRIEEKLRKRNSSDGIAALDGANNAQQQAKPSNSIFDVARDAQ
jgi:hypothetical protein